MVKERIHWIDIAKGIAILCVFIGHTVSTPGALSSFVYFFHMPAFFLLSGYCFSNRRKFGEFVVNKLKTIVLPIFTIGLSGAVLVGLMMQFVKHDAVDWKWIFLNPLVQCGEHSLLWYLAALFVDMLVFYGMTKLFKDRKAPLIIAAFVLGLGSYCFIKFVGIKTPWCVDTALVALPFITVGYVLKKAGNFERCGKAWVLILSFALCMITGVLNTVKFGGSEMHSNTYGNIFLFYISAFAGIMMLCSASMLIKKSKLIEYFGRNSLIFYAFEPIQYFANFALKALGLNDLPDEKFSLNLGITIIAVVFITAVSCLASAIINNYLPFLIGKKSKAKEINS